MFEITKEFRFEAAHTLDRRIEAEASRRIHGHSYRATVTLQGAADAQGMVVDFAALGALIGPIRAALDHRLLDEVPGLGAATLENLAAFIWRALRPDCEGLVRVAVSRDSEGERASYRG